MTAGLSSKLNILRESPLDHLSSGALEIKTHDAGPERWVASRYNIHSTTDDGRLILWNTLRGSISSFKAEQRLAVKGLLTKRGFEGEVKGLAKYLRDRGFLIPEGTDEYRLFQLEFGQQHYRQDTLELVLLASEDCNLRCEYCYEDFARGTMKPWVRDGIKKYVQKNVPKISSLSVAWFGGEPLYGWEAIEDLAPFFHATAAAHGLTLYSNMTTNGYLLTPDIAAKLLSWGIMHYQVTIDGSPEDHNRTRPARNGEPTFDVIFRNLLELKKRPENFLMEVRINFDRGSRTGLSDFIRLMGEEFGGDPRYRLRIRPVGRWGGSNDENLDVCNRDEVGEVTYKLIEEAAQVGLTSCDDLRYVNQFGSRACYAARPFNHVIGADGLVMKCTVDLDKKDRNIVGHLSQDGELKVDKAKVALWTEPAFSSDKSCQKCVILPLCQGISCPQIRMDEDRSPCVPLRSHAKKELRITDRFRSSRVRQAAVKLAASES